MEKERSEYRRLSCIHSIIGIEYSNYENPLRELLEYRKLACIKYMEGNEGKEELFNIMEYCNERIKLYLGIW